MSDDSGERHIRLVHFLANGCTKLLRALVEKLVENSRPNESEQAAKPWTLDDLLCEHQRSMSKNLNEVLYKKLFPGRREETNLEEWDICLLCFVVMHCADDWLVRQDIKKLKSIRNKVFHAGKTNIEKEQFDQFVGAIEVIVKRCCAFIEDDNFTQELQKFLDECKTGIIVKDSDDLRIIKEWCENDPFAELNIKVDHLSNDHKVMIDKLNEMIVLFKEHGLDHVTFPGTNVELVVKNCSGDKEKIISEHLVRLLSPKMSQLDLPGVPQADKEKIIELVREAMSELLKGGRELEELYHACVNLKIRCPSFENLRDLWTSCINGELTSAFKGIERYLHGLVECPELELEIGITHFELNRCLEATVMEIAKTVNSFAKVTGASDKEQEVLKYYANIMTNVQDTSTEDESLVVLNVQPSSFVQAERLWEACRSESFNNKLRNLAGLLQQAYDCEDLDISARLEEDSPYESVFQYKKTRVGILDSKAEVEQDSTTFETNERRNSDAERHPFINPDKAVETRVEELVEKHLEIQQRLECFNEVIRKVLNQRTEIEDMESMLKDLEKVIHLNNEAALQQKMEILQVQLVEYRKERENLELELSSQSKNIQEIIATVQAYLRSIIPDLKMKVKEGQMELVNTYVEFQESEFPNALAPCCSEVGYVLHELITTDLNRWRQLGRESSHILENTTDDDIYTRTHNYVCSAFHELMESTFVVSDQSDYCIRLFKKQSPTITLRLLAGDRIDIRAVEVKVILLPEDHVAFQENVIKRNVSDYLKLKAERKMFTRLKTDKFITTCGQLELELDDFEKLKSQQSSASYFKQFYRFVFFMTIEGNEYATMSLPVVVINDASESCCALGAIMWKCLHKDVFALPLETEEKLPWSKVANMLKGKLSRLSLETPLTEANLNHLKRRLTGQTDVSDDSTISMSKFCYEPVGDGCKFSFWKWVLANYNLVEKYLKHYWEEGLIGGFLSRNDVETMFQENPGLKSGTFILRFSDNHITDSVGTKSVFGILTAMVVVKMEVQVGSSTRIMPRYEAIEVANHNKLRKTPLANILKDSMDKRHINNIYKYLYPGLQRREDAFDKYCLTETSLSGYIKQQDAFIIEFEQGMFALKNPIRRQNSDSSDSVDSGLSNSDDNTRSSSPARDERGFGIYQRADSVIDLQIELSTPTTPINSIPNFLFTLPSGGTMFEGAELTNEIKAETRNMVNEVTEKLKHWVNESPEFFDKALKFLLLQIPEETLIRLKECI